MHINNLLSLYDLCSWEESEKLEWKLSTREGKEIVQTLVAFANTRGGVVIVGIDDKGNVLGQDISDATVREVSQTILANTAEKLYPNIERITLDNKSLLGISVTESPLKPHIAYGRAYKRVGSTNAVMDQSEYHLLLGQKKNGGGADRDICEDATVADLNTEQISQFVVVANEKRNLNLPVLADPIQTLESLELIQLGKVTKGALLLFGRAPQKFLPQAEFRLAYFKDESREVFLSQKEVRGNLFEQFDSIVAFAKEHLAMRVDTNQVGDRTSRQLSISAIQELAANCLIHRDYRDSASSYMNIVANQEIEFMNPGLLPAPRVTAENIGLVHPSVPVNRRLARVFFLAGIIEQWGEGTRRVIRQVAEAGLPTPKWESERGMVRVVVKLR